MCANDADCWSKLPENVRLECVMKWTKKGHAQTPHRGTETDDAAIKSGSIFTFSVKSDGGIYRARLTRRGNVFRGHFTFTGDISVGAGPGNAECTICAETEPYLLKGTWTQTSGDFNWFGELHPI